jgi:hypothetical protein
MALLDTHLSHRPAEARELDRNRELFVLARAQIAAGRADTLKREAERRRWRPHRRRFT